MSTADTLIRQYHETAMASGYCSDREVLNAWAKDPMSLGSLMNLRLLAYQAKEKELGLNSI